MAHMKLNESSKAMIAEMAINKIFEDVLEEYKIASTNTRIGITGQSELKKLYPRNNGDASGATKTVHTKSAITGKPFKYIVIKRFAKYGVVFPKGSGNQLFDEVAAYNRIMESDERGSDFICPVIKAYFTKSNHNDPTGVKGLDNAVIVAQKATHIGDLRDACIDAEFMNRSEGYNGQDADSRYKDIKQWCRDNDLHDVVDHPANCGVIFDYSKRCYKAVIIDYAL